MVHCARFVSGSVTLTLAIAAIATTIVGTTASTASAAKTCPEEMALVGGSCIDRWEGSLVEVLPNGSEITYTPYATPVRHKVRAVSKPGVVPQAHISMALAQKACAVAEKRLCHASEWVAACRGSSGGTWPYGASHVPGLCIDDGRTHPLQSLYSGEAMYENRNMNDPRLNQLPNTIALTGSAPQCTNGNGVYDLVGNVNEWIDDKTMRGGFYLDVDELGQGCDYATKVHSMVYNDYSTGFRCCKDASDEGAESAESTQSMMSTSTSAPGEIGTLGRIFGVRVGLAPLAQLIGYLAKSSHEHPVHRPARRKIELPPEYGS